MIIARFVPFLFLLVLLGCSPEFGPKIHRFKKNGQVGYTSKIYAELDGKRTLVQKDTYLKKLNASDSDLYIRQRSVLYYEKWPNNEWKFVSEKGFTVFDNGVYYLNDSTKYIPDNVLVRHFDSTFVEVIEVYQNGKRIPYTAGYPNGYRTMQYLRAKPGVYVWQNGVEHFERDFTEAEWDSHNKMNAYLNQPHVK